MLRDKVIDTIECNDNNADKLKIIEGINFSIKSLELNIINSDYDLSNSIIIDTGKARELGSLLLKWADNQE